MRYRVALLALYFSVPALAQSVPPAQAQGATTVDAETIEGVGDLQRVMVGEMVGRPVAVGVERDGAIVSLTVTPVELR